MPTPHTPTSVDPTADDPYAAAEFDREPPADRVEVVVVGGGPPGPAILGTELFTVDAEYRTPRAVSLITGESRVDVEDPAVGPPPGVDARAEAALFTQGTAGSPRLFAGPAAASDGSLLLSANGEGSLVRLSPASPPGPRRFDHPNHRSTHELRYP